MANILKRNIVGGKVQDPSAIVAMEYSNASGGKKITEVGRHLLPLPTPGVGSGYTTDLSSAAYALPSAGRNLAVYNNSGSVQAITFGTDNTVTALAVGVTDSSGRVGLPCMPNSWSYFAGGYSNWVISGSSNLIIFLINDDTSITVQSQAFGNNNGNPV
jgi:hypothetical protein